MDRKPTDPRVVFAGRHRERGPKALLVVTYPAIARATGLTVGTVKNAVTRGELDTTDLESIVAFIHRRRARSQQRRTSP
jgi:hypothetical protein